MNSVLSIQMKATNLFCRIATFLFEQLDSEFDSNLIEIKAQTQCTGSKGSSGAYICRHIYEGRKSIIISLSRLTAGDQRRREKHKLKKVFIQGII